MRAFKEQYDCEIEYFTVSEEYVEYKERQTKKHQGAEGSSRRGARKSVQHQNMENRWRREREIYQPFVEYVGHRPQGDKVPGIFFLTPVTGQQQMCGIRQFLWVEAHCQNR